MYCFGVGVYGCPYGPLKGFKGVKGLGLRVLEIMENQVENDMETGFM